MRLSLQTGETEKLTGVFDGLRDRPPGARDRRRRDLHRPPRLDGRHRHRTSGRSPDLVAPAARGTGTIICNVQRYNPTPAQLAAVAAIQGRTKTTVNGVVPLASPIGLDNSISECVPFNIMGHGQITPAAADYITTPKWGDRRRRAGFRGAARCAASSPTAGARDRCRSRRASPIATSRSTTAPIPSRSTSSGRLSTRRTSAFAASASTLVRRQPEPASVLDGVGDRGRLRRLGGIRRAQRADLAIGIGRAGFGMSFAYRSSDYSNVGRFDSWKIGLDFQIYRDLRLRATRVARRARSDLQRAVRQLAGAAAACWIPPATIGRRRSRSTTAGNPGLRPGGGRHDGRRVRLSAELGRGPANVGRPLRSRHLGLDRDAGRAAKSSTSAASSGVLCENVFRDDARRAVAAW